MNSVEGRFRDLDAYFSILKDNHQVSLNFVHDKVVVLRRLVCSGVSSSGLTEGHPNKIKVPEPKPFTDV